MPQGRYPTEYLSNAEVRKPKEEIYRDINDYSLEYFEDEPAFHAHIDVVVVSPPVSYEGRFLKGVLYSQAVDFLYKLYPRIGDLFFTVANSQWCSFPKSERADAYFSCYSNPEREDWFRRSFPDRRDKILVPLQDADRTHEYKMVPGHDASMQFDVVCVSRMQELKNIPLIASALKIFRQKHYPIRMVLIPGKPFGLNLHGLTEHELAIWRQVEEILVHPHDYIELVPQAQYGTELPKYYANAKLCVLGALIEGKNRSIYESAMCDTPVVWFEDFNKFARGRCHPLAEGAGRAAPHFDAESLADTFFDVLDNRTEFKPRKSVLEVSGRKNFLSKIIDSIPYFESRLPDFGPGRHFTNLWLDLAIQDNYHLNLHDFTYDKSCAHSWARGLQQIDKMMRIYFDHCGVDRSPGGSASQGDNVSVLESPGNFADLPSAGETDGDESWRAETPVIVVGLSRARLSAIARGLRDRGVFMGERFGESCETEEIVYEDQEFVDLNEGFLVKHTISYSGWRDAVTNTIQRRWRLRRAWGWADVHTSTLVWQYQQLLPNAKFIHCSAASEEVARQMKAAHPTWNQETIRGVIAERQQLLQQHLPEDAAVVDEDVPLEGLDELVDGLLQTLAESA